MNPPLALPDFNCEPVATSFEFFLQPSNRLAKRASVDLSCTPDPVFAVEEVAAKNWHGDTPPSAVRKQRAHMLNHKSKSELFASAAVPQPHALGIGHIALAIAGHCTTPKTRVFTASTADDQQFDRRQDYRAANAYLLISHPSPPPRVRPAIPVVETKRR